MFIDFDPSKIQNVHNLELIQTGIREAKIVNHSAVIERFKNNNYLDDPIFLGYRPFFHYTTTSGLLAPEQHINSALAYLNRIGEKRRYLALQQFIRMLQKINVDMTYMFQTIEGLQEAKDNFDVPICWENNTITFGMLETIDMRIQSLISIYRDIVYDSRRHVWVLPRNLRQFSCSVCVFPIGTYNVTTDSELQAIPNAQRDDTIWKRPADAVNEFNHVLFEFAQCEFSMLSSSQGFIDSVSNNEMNMALNSLAFTYARTRQSGLFTTMLGATQTGGASFSMTSVIKDKSLGKRTVEFLKEAGAPIIKDAKELMKRYEAVRDENGKVTKSGFKNVFSEMFGSAQIYVERNAQAFLSNQLNRLYLGNIYDITASDIVALSGSRSIENAIINAGRMVGTLKDQRGTSGQSDPPHGSVFPEEIKTPVEKPSGNIYKNPK